MQLHTPKRTMPTVQRARANLVLKSLLNVGRGYSVGMMYIALTMSR